MAPTFITINHDHLTGIIFREACGRDSFVLNKPEINANVWQWGKFSHAANGQCYEHILNNTIFLQNSIIIKNNNANNKNKHQQENWQNITKKQKMIMKRMKQKIFSSFGYKRSLARSTRPIMVLQENKSQVARKHRRVNTEFTTICTRQVLCPTQKASGLGNWLEMYRAKIFIPCQNWTWIWCSQVQWKIVCTIGVHVWKKGIIVNNALLDCAPINAWVSFKVQHQAGLY